MADSFQSYRHALFLSPERFESGKGIFYVSVYIRRGAVALPFTATLRFDSLDHQKIETEA